MKILFVVDNFPPETNAVAARAYERAVYWHRWGHDVTILTSAPNFPEGRLHPGYRNAWKQVEEIDGLSVVRVKTFIAPNKGMALRVIDFSSFLVSSFLIGSGLGRFDVVVGSSPQLFAAVAASGIAGITRRPFVVEIADLWPKTIRARGFVGGLLYQVLEGLELLLYRHARRIVVLTQAFKRDLVSRGVAPERIAVVQNGADLTTFYPCLPDEQLRESLDLEGRFIVGYIGTLGLNHNLINALEAAKRLRLEEGIVFLFVGAGAEADRLHAFAHRHGLSNVRFVGRQAKGEMRRYWSVCDVALVHLISSDDMTEVIPSKIFEAFAMGKPMLLAAPEGEASALVQAHDAGLCVRSDIPDDLAAAVLALRDSPGECARLAANALAAAPLHTRERQARAFLEVLDSAKTDI